MKKISTLTGLIIIILIAVFLFGGVFAYKYYFGKPASPVNLTESWKNYKNAEYGFTMTFPDSWKGFTVEKGEWQGWRIDGESQGPSYKGTQLLFKNPQSTAKQPWQDIPIMVFTHEMWNLVSQEKVAVSAAPIGPAKIGENAKYVFATPPRWYGFTDEIGFEEAVNIVKTFKAF